MNRVIVVTILIGLVVAPLLLRAEEPVPPVQIGKPQAFTTHAIVLPPRMIGKSVLRAKQGLAIEVRIAVRDYQPRGLEPTLLIDGLPVKVPSGVVGVEGGVTILGFVLERPELFSEGASLSLQMGDDVRTRLEVPGRLERSRIELLEPKERERLGLPGIKEWLHERGRPIRLRSREFTPGAGIDTKLQGFFEQRPEGERVHVLMQLNRMPSLKERAVLEEELRVRLLDPLPDNAFFATIPADHSAVKRLLERGGPARWIGRIAAGDKVSPWLIEKGFPVHALRGKGMGEAIVQFFGDVPREDQQKVLRTHDVRILNRIEPLNGWRILIEQKAILGLAGEDLVKWIEEVPAPPEDDNDGVRGASGVNADPVLSGTGYNLTGNGVNVAQWESTNASLAHGDFAGRITLADPPLPANDRTHRHDESVTVNAQFDDGEAVYRDIDDSSTVTAGDVRVTATGGFAAGSVVAAGDADAGTGIVTFGIAEKFADNVTADFAYTAGEPAYIDVDNSRSASTGDTRITASGGFAAGTVVAAGDADTGLWLWRFPTNPHYHSTHVAGTLMGSGVQSAAQGGTATQWQGVAPAAQLRSYSGSPISGTGSPVPADEYTDAALNAVAISTNSWGTSHCHQVVSPATCYEAGSQYYDSIISGRRSDGTPSGLARQILILGSSGNRGRPERHAEDIAANGQYDAGEAIYYDYDDSGTVTAVDVLRSGTAQPAGTALVNFALDERHDESVSTNGLYEGGEAIYRDVDGSLNVSAGDTRLSAAAGFPASTVVAAADGDVGTALRQFRLWGNVRIPNSAKNTIEVGNITSDTNTLWPSSSRGPTNDGRIKPDMAGPGSQAGGDSGVTSAYPGNNYASLTGTSMSTPAIAGSAALLWEWYLTGCTAGDPQPATVKALLIHGAKDMDAIPNVGGTFTGPDFAFGFGRARVKEALDLLPHHVTGSAAAVGSTDYKITLGAMQPLKVTLAWDDPPWTANAAPSPATGILQNDLDLLLIAPDGAQYTPWIADAANPFATAVRSSVAAGTAIPASARDRRNTVEQVIVDNAMAGTWTIRVTASTLNLPAQSYAIVSEALPPQDGPCTATPATDVWMKDNAPDTGTVPSTGTMWLSPDLWNRLNPDGLTSHENPEFGQLNYLYANIRNASPADTARATSIDVWIAPASTGLSWPASFSYVGRFPVPNLAPGEVRKVGPFEWDPPDPSASNHFCFYVRIASAQDPITFAEVASVGTNARNSNNIVWRNINVVDLASSRSVAFLVRNVGKKETDVELSLEVPEEFMKIGRVRLQLSRELEKRWSPAHRSVKGLTPALPEYRAAPAVPAFPDIGADLEQRRYKEPLEPGVVPRPIYDLAAPSVRLRGLRLEPQQAEQVILTFQSDQRTKGSYNVDVIQRANDGEVGGIRYEVRTGYSGRE